MRKALASGERPEDVMPALSRALLQQGQADRLIGEWAGREFRDPAAAAAVGSSVGHAWLMRGDAGKAADAFDNALAAVPRYAPARLGLARIAAQRGKLDEAAAVADEVIGEDPRLVDAHALKAQVMLSRGQRGAAAEALERIVSIDAGNVAARAALVSLRVGAREYEKARASLASHAAVASDRRLIYLRGLLALRSGELQKAHDEAEVLLRRAPEQAAGLTLAGEIELQSGSPTLAESYLQRAVHASPRAPTARRLLAGMYLRLGLG